MKPLALLALAALLPLVPAFADEAAEFTKHWTAAKELTLAVADAMPSKDYGFKPDPGSMTFFEQMAHIAEGNYGYCSGIAREKSPYAIPSKEDKPAAAKLIGDSFDYCAKIIGGMTGAQFNEMRGPEGRQMSLRELTLAALVHMAHHRGQSEVYLRAKGITPPTYKF